MGVTLTFTWGHTQENIWLLVTKNCQLQDFFLQLCPTLLSSFRKNQFSPWNAYHWLKNVDLTLKSAQNLDDLKLKMWNTDKIFICGWIFVCAIIILYISSKNCWKASYVMWSSLICNYCDSQNIVVLIWGSCRYSPEALRHRVLSGKLVFTMQKLA